MVQRAWVGLDGGGRRSLVGRRVIFMLFWLPTTPPFLLPNSLLLLGSPQNSLSFFFPYDNVSLQNNSLQNTQTQVHKWEK